MEEKLIIIKTLAQLKELEDYIADKDFIAYDTETTGVEKESEIIGFSISADTDTGYYVIISYWDVVQQKLVYLETKEGIKAFLEKLIGKKLIMHNAIFDCSMTFNNYQIELMPFVHTDTMILAQLLDENRSCGLKELAVAIFGEDSRAEQMEMKESVSKNGGMLTRENYELYKADCDLIARYGAKDTILTLKVFYHLVPELYEQKLETFFYEEESMPLLRGPTYELNTVGLRIDPDKLQKLKLTLETECLEAKTFFYQQVAPIVKDKYPGTSKATTFNIAASKQLAWLLFIKLGNEFNLLTKEGKNVCKALDLKLPYAAAAKREFLAVVAENKGRIYQEAIVNPKTGKMGRPKKVGDVWNYLSCGKESLNKLSSKYVWVKKLLEYSKNQKLLNTYVLGIQGRMRYNMIRPNFLQHGTTSGRYSCKRPNFQNLPRDDKRVKACIVSNPGEVFVGADYSQLEPRVFASISGDETLTHCFAKGEDFYSVVGAPIFEKTQCSLFKSDKDSFAVLHPGLRDRSKIIALATPYGRTAAQQATTMGITRDESQRLIDRYFEAYPKVELMMLESHETVKRTGVVHNLFGRPRRIPEALKIRKYFGDTPHGELPYEARNLLNLAMNHRVQSTAASIMNRAAIECWQAVQELAQHDPRWAKVKVVLQVHDELVLKGPEALKDAMVAVLKDAMENTTRLPGVALIAEPKIAHNIADLK